MDMSGLVFTYLSLYILNKGILLLLINNFLFAMCCFPLVIFYFWLVNLFLFYVVGLQVRGKLVHNRPLQEFLRRGRCFKTFFPFWFFSIKFFF